MICCHRAGGLLVDDILRIGRRFWNPNLQVERMWLERDRTQREDAAGANFIRSPVQRLTSSLSHIFAAASLVLTL